MASSKTVKSSGGDYTTLSAWEDANDGDLTGTGVAEVTCFALTDSTALSISGWTTTASDYIYIHTDSSARHAGVWDASKYNLSVSNADTITFSEDFVRIDGLQISTSAVNATSQDCLYWISGAVGSGATYHISNCLIKGCNDATNAQNGLNVGDVDCNINMWNTAVYNFYAGGATPVSVPVTWNGTTGNFYNCVLIGGKYAINVNGASSVITMKNCYAGGSYTEDYYRANGKLYKYNCASEDASADDTSGADETQSNCITSVALTTDTFLNVTGGSEDYHLAGTGSGLYDTGVDTSGDSAPMNFTTDIDGDTRSRWDIGIDEYSSGATATNVIMNII